MMFNVTYYVSWDEPKFIHKFDADPDIHLVSRNTNGLVYRTEMIEPKFELVEDGGNGYDGKCGNKNSKL